MMRELDDVIDEALTREERELLARIQDVRTVDLHMPSADERLEP